MTTTTKYDHGSVTVWLSIDEAERARCIEALQAAGLSGEVESGGPEELSGLVVAHIPHSARPESEDFRDAELKISQVLTASGIRHEVRGTGYQGTPA